MKFLTRTTVRIIARKEFQTLFSKLHLLSLAGMNVGTGSKVADSGELSALSWAKMKFDAVKNPVVFDVGANLGEFARASARIMGERATIYCFEPAAATFKSLQRNLSEHRNIRFNNIGMGEKAEEVSLYSDRDGSGIASVYDRKLPFDDIRLSNVEKIKILSIDGFCAENEISHIHYLKLDIEGHELSALKGARDMIKKGGIDAIQFEFGGCNIDSRTYFRDFFELLSPQYAIYRLLQTEMIRLEKYRELDEIFATTNFIAISKSISENAETGGVLQL